MTIDNLFYKFQLYESLHVKLEDALKEKLVALEDRLNILTQLRDSEQRAADSEAFIKIMKVSLNRNIFTFRCNIIGTFTWIFMLKNLLFLVLQSECDSKQDLFDATVKENRSLEKLMREQSKQLHEQSEEIIMLKKLFINS